VRIGFVATDWNLALVRISDKYGRPPLQEVGGKNAVLPPGKIQSGRTLVWPLDGGILRLVPGKAPIVLYVSDAETELRNQGY